MRRQIFIYINGETVNPQDDTMPVCWVVKEAEQMPGPVFYGDLKTAANHATGCRVVVFVSAINILLPQVDLPAMNKQRLARAIPFALEEHVASDIERLHFAVGNRFGDKTACAVVEKRDMESWQQLLKNANIQADVLVSECFGVSYEEGAWHVLINRAPGVSGTAVMRNGEQSGFAMDAQNLPFILKNTLDNSQEDQLPSRIHVTVCSDRLRRQTLISANQDELPTLHTDENAADSETTLVPEQSGEGATENSATPANMPEVDINGVLEQIQILCADREVEFSCKESEQGYLHHLSQGFSARPWVWPPPGC
jgi:type II secretion system protein L